MKTLLLVAGLFAFAAAANAQEFDCSKPENLPQMGMNKCAYDAWQEADLELNKLWPSVREYFRKLDESNREFFGDLVDGEKSLLKAQRAWINYRDGHCDTEGAIFTGGSIRPLIVNTCLETLTRARTKELFDLIQER